MWDSASIYRLKAVLAQSCQLSTKALAFAKPDHGKSENLGIQPTELNQMQGLGQFSGCKGVLTRTNFCDFLGTKALEFSRFSGTPLRWMQFTCNSIWLMTKPKLKPLGEKLEF